jgi:hypothetical protein
MTCRRRTPKPEGRPILAAWRRLPTAKIAVSESARNAAGCRTARIRMPASVLSTSPAGIRRPGSRSRPPQSRKFWIRPEILVPNAHPNRLSAPAEQHRPHRCQRPRRFSIRFQALPTLLTAFFTADAECGRTLEAWNGSRIPQFRKIKDAPKDPEAFS